ncbi:MAG: RNA polymerase sigma factor FliA, partial [Betaproteobacteria bacterium]
MYTATGTHNRKEWIKQYAPLVKRIAHHIMAKLPASVQVDDIVQAGMIGLMDAVERYEDAQGAQFETYAAQRIRGAMLDELRSSDWLPRGIRKNMRTIEKSMHALEQRLGRQPNEQEIADHMHLPLAEYQQMLQEARGHQLVYYEDFSEDDDASFLDRHSGRAHPSPLDTLLDEGMRARLIAAIESLPEREKTMMGLYYEQDLNLREIGEILGVT